jgi:REP element-mobilizing transposase RayT
MSHKTYYRRNLPHIQPKNGVFAVTICLKGSLPKAKIEALRDARDLMIKEAEANGASEMEIKRRIQKSRAMYFGKFDALLDGATTGPIWLTQPEIARIVMDSLDFINNKWCKVVAYCIMSNHIHIVLYKCEKQLYEILGSMKRYTATRANEVLYGKCPKGQQHPTFWLEESYDHLIRNREDFSYQVQYVLNNPVKAELVKSWKAWTFHYVREEFEYIMP